MKKRVLSLLIVTVLLLTSVSFAFADSSYTIKSGDVLWKIAERYGTTWQKLAEINKLSNPHLIYPNQIIKLEETVPVPSPTPAPSPVPAASGKFKAGTYTASADGRNGPVTVEVTFDTNSITSVRISKHSETAGIADAALERLPKAIIDGQTLAVDAVAGASFTSAAILAAVEDCVKQAGGDAAALKVKGTKGNTSQGETVLTTDVVVVGAGGTGLAAAASAYLNGADVIVLEKLAAVGGSTARSGGAIAGPGNRFQKEKGIEDSKEAWLKTWKERQATSNPGSKYPDYTRVDKFIGDAAYTIEWLVDVIGHKYSTIEGFGVDPALRLHYPAPVGSLTNGAALIKNVENFVRGKGINILLETPATELITDGAGNVTGVIATGREGKVRINAKKTILATGGFAKSEELLKRFVPRMAGTAESSLAGTGSTGDGILMAEKIGAALYEDPWVIGLGIGAKVKGTDSIMMDWTKVYVDAKGERFTSEETHYAMATNKVEAADAPWLVLDSAKANEALVKALEAASPSGEVAKGSTLEELARAMGVPADTFVKTMNTYNSGAKSGTDALGKEKQYLVPVETAPYYALKIYPKTMGTFGGVKTNENYQVLRVDGTIINNLYAGGECANRIMYNQVYMTGSAVQFALTSGRLAGKHAAESLQKVLNTDVVVVGAGGTGLAAAASAYLNGADVLVLEKLAAVGGSTARSGGGISATGTKTQAERGITDKKESWMNLWKERQATSNPGSKYPDYSRVDNYMDEAVITTNWLVDVIGHKYGRVEGFMLDTVARIHFPADVGELKNGAALIKNVENFVRGKGINILLETPATELITDSGGNVTGVIARSKEGTLRINAKKTILATGGFAKSESLLKRFVPEMTGTAASSVAGTGSTGDGILMAERAGAALYEDPWVIGMGIRADVAGTGSIGMDWYKLYVNGKGERFTSEQMHYAVATNVIAAADKPWLIADSTKANEALVKALDAGIATGEVVKADTVQALAGAMGVPADTLAKTVDTYNTGAKTGVDAFGKEKQYIVPVGTAPYYAVKIYPYTMGTFGGVKTNGNYQVLRADGTIINNLYAGGECSNRILYNQVYMSGSAVQLALTSGRVSGQHAALSLK